MSAKPQSKSRSNSILLNTNDIFGQTSIEPPPTNSFKANHLSDISKLHKISAPKTYNISKIEHWEAKQSEDGMKINLKLNINFNLKSILVSLFIKNNF